jgi:hypothetical protein
MSKSKKKAKHNGHSADPRSEDFKPLFLKGLPKDGHQFVSSGFNKPKGERSSP